jgi:hypothetical protein
VKYLIDIREKILYIPAVCLLNRREYRMKQTSAIAARGTATVGITQSLLVRPEMILTVMKTWQLIIKHMFIGTGLVTYLCVVGSE